MADTLNFVHKKGDTFKEVAFHVNVNGSDLDLTGAVIRMQLRKECGGKVYLSLTSVASAGITITAPLTGDFKINQQVIDIDPYNYCYDIEIKLADLTVNTWVKGEFLIECDITR